MFSAQEGYSHAESSVGNSESTQEYLNNQTRYQFVGHNSNKGEVAFSDVATAYFR